MIDVQSLAITAGIILIFYVSVLLLIFFDLWAGVRKARMRNELRTSEKYKRTIDKVNKYYNMMLALTVVDVIQFSLVFLCNHLYGYSIPYIPVFSFFGTCYVAFVEVTSIMEPADIKEKKQMDDFKRLFAQLIREDKNFREKVATMLEEGGGDEKS